MRKLSLFDDVALAFKLGAPRFDEVIDQRKPDFVAVLPMTTSEGYFTSTYLPSELAKNHSYRAQNVAFQRPLGVHAGVANIVEKRIIKLCGSSPKQAVDVAVIGHGTTRHAGSTDATEALAELLRGRGLQTMTAYLDSPPGIESLRDRWRRSVLIVIPFLMAHGPHAAQDIPTRLGLSPTGAWPLETRIDDRRIVCDLPFGLDPALDELMQARAHEAHDLLQQMQSEQDAHA